MAGKLVNQSIHETKTAAGHFAKGYRSKRFGKPGKPAGSVRVGKVGKYWGVFDLKPHLPSSSYVSLDEGKRQGKRHYG